jgi:exodeoxyribonuclease-3
MNLFSWNVNGIRAAQKKGFLEWVTKTRPDVICLQETKAQPEQLDPELLAPEGYRSYWASAERKGYTMTLSC